MPVSKSFKDISITFDKNPVTGDLLATKNDAAIKGAIKNLVLTKPGERFFNPNIGCRVSGLLFEPLDFITAGLIHDEIEYTINAFEPRVVLKNINVDADFDSNGFNVDIEYTIVGQPESIKDLSFFLERTTG